MIWDRKRYNKYQKEWQKKRRLQIRTEILAGKSCERCGKTTRLHVKKNDGRMVVGWATYSKKSREEFLKNTTILCRRHYNEAVCLQRGFSAPRWTIKTRKKAESERKIRQRKEKKIAKAKIALIALGFKLK